METQEAKMNDISEFLARKQLKKDTYKREREERIASGRVRDYIVSRDLSGLYFVRNDGGGPLPECLKGKFTTMQKLQTTIDNYRAKR